MQSVVSFLREVVEYMTTAQNSFFHMWEKNGNGTNNTQDLYFILISVLTFSLIVVVQFIQQLHFFPYVLE